MDYLGKKPVDSCEAQDHGCTDEAVELLWNDSPDSPLTKRVSIKVSNVLVTTEFPQIRIHSPAPSGFHLGFFSSFGGGGEHP